MEEIPSDTKDRQNKNDFQGTREYNNAKKPWEEVIFTGWKVETNNQLDK